jgi:hypothetical protein
MDDKNSNSQLVWATMLWAFVLCRQLRDAGLTDNEKLLAGFREVAERFDHEDVKKAERLFAELLNHTPPDPPNKPNLKVVE